MREVEKAAGMDALEELLAERFRNPADFGAPWRAYASGSGEPRHDELELTRPAGRVFERYSRPVLDAEGHPLGWLELYRDVTGERQIQSKMLQTEKMAALGQLVSGIAHELNNPLTAIMGYAQLMLGHGLNLDQFSEAKKVYQEAERARRIVKNLLYFARETAPERTQVDVNEIVERTLALRSYEPKTENIVVTCELAPGLPQTVADPYQLQQVVLNLLINAEQALLEARGQGHVLIRTTHMIEGVGHHAVDRIVLEVSDDGPGVSPEIASRIFDPFFTTKQPGLGTGLGLSIVYGIVHQHHGEVTFENQATGGAHFVVELPVVAVPANTRAPLLLGTRRTKRRFADGPDSRGRGRADRGATRCGCAARGRTSGRGRSRQPGRADPRVAGRLRPCDLRSSNAAVGWSGILRCAGANEEPDPQPDHFHHRRYTLAAHTRLSRSKQAALPCQAFSGRRDQTRRKSRIDCRGEAGSVRPMSVITSCAIAVERVPLLGIADPDVAQRMIQALKGVPGTAGLVVASSLEHFRQVAADVPIEVILLDSEFIGNVSLEDFLRHVAVSAPVVLVAPLKRQTEVVRLVAAGNVEFVARVGDFAPLAAGLVERRLRWAAASARHSAPLGRNFMTISRRSSATKSITRLREFWATPSCCSRTRTG